MRRDRRAGAGANLQIPDVEDGKFNVAMVLIGPHDDGGWSQAHYEGLQYLCENMPDSHVAYIEHVPEGADSEQVFRSLARKGFNFIIGTSFGYMDPMATVAEEFPDITYLHLTGYKSNGKNFGNFFGAMEDFKYLAGMLAGSRAKKDGNPKIGYMATFPIPEELRLGNAIMRGVKADLPRVHDGRPRSSTPGTTRSRRRTARPSLFDAGADVVFTGADTPRRRRRRPGEGQVGRHLRPPGLVQGRALPDRAVLDLGPRVRPHRRSRSRPRPTRPATSTSTPTRRRWACTASWTARRRSKGVADLPAADVQKVKDTLAKMLAGDVRPVRRLRRTDQGQHRQGAPARPARSSSSPTSTSSRPAHPGNECKTCMYWWADGHHRRAARPSRS